MQRSPIETKQIRFINQIDITGRQIQFTAVDAVYLNVIDILSFRMSEREIGCDIRRSRQIQERRR